MISEKTLLGQDQALSILEDALSGSPAHQTELVLLNDKTQVTRYANSEIQQNVSQVNTRVAARVAVGKATARVYTNSLNLNDLRQAIQQAVQIAGLQAPNPRFQSLPTPASGYPPATNPPQSYFEATSALSPEARAEAVGRISEAAASEGYSAFGTYRSSAAELAVASSTGIRVYAPYTTVYLKVLIAGPAASGFSDAYDRDATCIDPARVAQQAIARCRANHDQVELEPGEYEALFEPNAVADMVRFPTVWGMGARQVLDGQSFMSGRIGEPVAGASVSIWDDPNDPRCLPLAIDYEGLPAQRVDIITNGIARGPVYDSQTALEAGTRSTGHAENPFDDSPSGPQANHIIMPTGTSSIEQMISHIKNGVWITRFHYTHCPDRKRTIATGTTRDGTFLIRDGRVVGALKNLRIEMSVLDLLSSLQEAGEGKLCQDWWAANGMDYTNYFVPSMRLWLPKGSWSPT